MKPLFKVNVLSQPEVKDACWGMSLYIQGSEAEVIEYAKKAYPGDGFRFVAEPVILDHAFVPGKSTGCAHVTKRDGYSEECGLLKEFHSGQDAWN